MSPTRHPEGCSSMRRPPVFDLELHLQGMPVFAENFTEFLPFICRNRQRSGARNGNIRVTAGHWHVRRLPFVITGRVP
jgi:hypothetical protein